MVMSRTRRINQTTSGKLTLKRGAAAGSVLDPRLAAVGVGVLGDERQAEPGTDAMAGRAAAGEAFEDAGPFATRHARPDVVDRQRHAVTAVLFDLHAGRAAGMFAGVLQEVGQDPLETQLVDLHGLRNFRIDLDGCFAEAVALGDAG
jgi:hypothetical protein